MAHQCLCDPQALDHPLRKLSDLLARGATQPHLVQEGGDLIAKPPLRHPEQPPAVFQKLLSGQILVERRILRQKADTPPSGGVAQRAPQYLAGARSGPN